MSRRLSIALVCALLLTCRERTTSTFEQAPVIVISIDTLRADHLPMYGYRAIATPHLDALRRDGVLFTSAFAQVPLTLPSHATMLTGLLPTHHGVRNNIGYTLAAETPTIPTMLRTAGYASGAAVSAYVLRGSTGIAQSFDFYDDAIENQPGTPIGTLQRKGSATIAIAKQWIAQHASQPFFFLLHLFEPHAPYEPTYDAEIVASDALVGDFIADLKARGIYDRAIVIVMSDHGEGLSQHGEPEHGIFLYREAIHVPLVVKLPKNARAGETIDAPVGLVDLLPTIAHLTKVAPPAKLDGQSLFAPRADRTIYSESLYPRIHLGWSELRSLHGPQFHFIQAPRPELYDAQRDPAETRNVLSDQRRVYSAMKTELERYGSDVTLPRNIDPEEAKKLAALGYLGSSATPASGPLPDPKERIGDIADLGKATELVRVGRDDEAIALLRSVVERNPRLSDAWNLLGTTLEKRGRDREAAEAYRTAIRQSPELAGEFALSLGGVLLRLGRIDDAIQHARLAEKTNAIGTSRLLVRIAEKIAERDPAAALKLLENAPSSEALDSARGDALARLQRYDEAIVVLRRNIQAYPDEETAYQRLAIVYAVTGRAAEARAVIAQLTIFDPQRGEQVRRELGF